LYSSKFFDLKFKLVFSFCFLNANVIPIPKPGKDHSEPSNYRPIALSSCVCKTMERMINVPFAFEIFEIRDRHFG
jgi:hypothetical protein